MAADDETYVLRYEKKRLLPADSANALVETSPSQDNTASPSLSRPKKRRFINIKCIRACFFLFSSTRLAACGRRKNKHEKMKQFEHREGALFRQPEHREGTHTRTEHTLNMREEALFIWISRLTKTSRRNPVS